MKIRIGPPRHHVLCRIPAACKQQERNNIDIETHCSHCMCWIHPRCFLNPSNSTRCSTIRIWTCSCCWIYLDTLFIRSPMVSATACVRSPRNLSTTFCKDAPFTYKLFARTLVSLPSRSQSSQYPDIIHRPSTIAINNALVYWFCIPAACLAFVPLIHRTSCASSTFVALWRIHGTTLSAIAMQYFNCTQSQSLDGTGLICVIFWIAESLLSNFYF